MLWFGSRFIASLLVIYCITASCEQLVTKKFQLSTRQNERMNEVQWNKVDRFPAPSSCDFEADLIKTSECRSKFLARSIGRVPELLRGLKNRFGDTLKLNLSVDFEGHASFGLRLNSKEIVKGSINKDTLVLDLISRLNQCISKELWIPGLKRGVPISVTFPYDLVLQ